MQSQKIHVTLDFWSIGLIRYKQKFCNPLDHVFVNKTTSKQDSTCGFQKIESYSKNYTWNYSENLTHVICANYGEITRINEFRSSSKYQEISVARFLRLTFYILLIFTLTSRAIHKGNRRVPSFISPRLFQAYITLKLIWLHQPLRQAELIKKWSNLTTTPLMNVCLNHSMQIKQEKYIIGPFGDSQFLCF